MKCVSNVTVMKLFGYDKFVALTSGGEAADAAVKIARKWGYMAKKIPHGQYVEFPSCLFECPESFKTNFLIRQI
jgi:hypothetical protein